MPDTEPTFPVPEFCEGCGSTACCAPQAREASAELGLYIAAERDKLRVALNTIYRSVCECSELCNCSSRMMEIAGEAINA